MPPLLEAAEFSRDELPLVADFSCGTEPWEVAMAKWIREPQTLRFGNSKHDTTVWLYYHPDGRIVGFGSLGLTHWKMPPDGRPIELSIIPALAIKTAFQHLPADNFSNPSFSHQLLADLIGKAALQHPDSVVLFVHEKNWKAIALYNAFGFETIPGPPIDRGGERFNRMYLRLR